LKKPRLDDINDFLKSSYPHAEGILIGCQATVEFTSYDCCEYDIIVLESDNENPIDIKNKGYHLIQLGKKNLELSVFKNENFLVDQHILFQDFVKLTNSFVSGNLYSYSEKKKLFVKTHLKTLCKKKLLHLALFTTEVIKQVLKGKFNQTLPLFNLRMISLGVLELMIELFVNKIPSPSHLKYQINSVKELNPKLKENIDMILELIDIDRSNVSTITRSENSLFFFMRNITSSKVQIELLSTKLNFFKSKSMYVDGNLLIHSFIKNHYFNSTYVQNYNKLFNYVLDIPNKDQIKLTKELEQIFNVIKNLIRNSY
jgi:hypothetical protein